MWQTVCIIGTLRADVTYKIILKNYNKQKKKPPHLKINKNQKNTKTKTKLIPQLNQKKKKKSE